MPSVSETTRSFWRRAGCIVVLSLHGVGRAAVAPPAPAPAPAAASSAASLQHQIDASIEQPRFAGAFWGIKVVSLDTGRTLAEHGAELPLSPASNSKLYTCAFLLDQLGGDYRIKTPVMATAAPDENGELKGNVVVSGRGDPSWRSRDSKQDFWATFDPFIDVLVRAKVRRITGDIVADATYFHAIPQGAGWTVDDLNYYYGAEVSAITLEDNYADLRVLPGNGIGAPCRVEMVHPSTGLVIDNRAVTIAAKGVGNISVLRLVGENTVHIFGVLPIDGKGELTESSVSRPAGWFAAALKEALVRRGIQVSGVARDVRWPEATAVAAGDVTLGEVVSPPLREMVSTILKTSQNLHADLLFTLAGEMQRAPETPSWIRSDELAVTALENFLRKNSLRADEVIFEEGSGLSRNNLTTAAATVSLLQFMTTHRESAAFSAALPIAGVDGSLRRRMKGTPAEGNVRAKTGSLRWANSLSGYVTTVSGERLAFSLMLNRYVTPGHRSARLELDEIAALLAHYDGKN